MCPPPQQACLFPCAVCLNYSGGALSIGEQLLNTKSKKHAMSSASPELLLRNLKQATILKTPCQTCPRLLTACSLPGTGRAGGRSVAGRLGRCRGALGHRHLQQVTHVACAAVEDEILLGCSAPVYACCFRPIEQQPHYSRSYLLYELRFNSFSTFKSPSSTKPNSSLVT